MDITPAAPAGRKMITGYGDGGFKVNGEFMSGSLLVFADQCMAWNISRPQEITPASLEPLLFHKNIELLLIGTGEHISAVDPAIRAFLKSRNIALDVMDTGAACRTFNVLAAEDRRVAAALIAI